MSSSSRRYGLVGVRVCFNSRNDSVSCSGKEINFKMQVL